MNPNLRSSGVARLHRPREPVAEYEGVTDTAAAMDVASGFEGVLDLDAIRAAGASVNELRSHDLAARLWPLRSDLRSVEAATRHRYTDESEHACSQESRGPTRGARRSRRRIRTEMRRNGSPGQRIDDMHVELVKAHVDGISAVTRQKIKGDGGEIGTELVKGLAQAKRKYEDRAA